MSRHTPEAIVNPQYRVRIGQYISDGWQIFVTNAVGYIGFLLLSALINGILGLIPTVGFVLVWIMAGWIMAGYYFVGFKIAHSQRPEFSNFFDGFKSNHLLPIFLTNLIAGLIVNLCVRAALFFFTATILPQPVAVLLGLIFLAGGLHYAVAYILAIPLVVEHQFNFWTAMETSRRLIAQDWSSFFLLSLTILLINLLGMVLLFVGLLVTVPLSTCVIVAAYRDIIGLNPSDGNYP